MNTSHLSFNEKLETAAQVQMHPKESNMNRKVPKFKFTEIPIQGGWCSGLAPRL